MIREKTVCYLEKVTLINSIKNCHTFCPLSCSQKLEALLQIKLEFGNV